MKIFKFFQIFVWNSSLNISRSMEYRFDFLLGLSVNLLLALAGPLFQYLLFSQVNGCPGWTVSEIILFQGVLLLMFGLKTLLLGKVPEYVQNSIWRGGLDRLLLRPYSSIGMILANGFSLDGIGTVLAGMIIIAVMLCKIGWKIKLLSCLAALAAIGMGLLLFAAFDILLACFMIRFIHIGRLNEVLDTLTKFGQYPIELFGERAGIVFITVLPFAVWVNIPCRILLDGLQGYMLLTFIMVILFYLMAVHSWNLCMKHYTSAGG